MSETFSYSSEQATVDPRMTTPAPLWSDFNPESEYSVMARDAKQRNQEDFWQQMRKVFARDFNHLPAERFKVWASTLIVPIMTRSRTTNQIAEVLHRASSSQTIRDALTEPMIGLTLEDFNQHYRVFDNANYTMNRIQHLYHLAKNGFLDTEQNYFEGINRIVEIGAGAGEMADVIRKLGFTGEYVTFDFPELLQIQSWYHKRLEHKNNRYISDVEELEPADLVIATWSLTEMPLELRDKVLDKLGESRDWLIAYSCKIFGFDNHDYIMNNFIPRVSDGKDVNITDVVLDNLPWEGWDGGTKYLTIKKTK